MAYKWKQYMHIHYYETLLCLIFNKTTFSKLYAILQYTCHEYYEYEYTIII